LATFRRRHFEHRAAAAAASIVTAIDRGAIQAAGCSGWARIIGKKIAGGFRAVSPDAEDMQDGLGDLRVRGTGRRDADSAGGNEQATGRFVAGFPVFSLFAHVMISNIVD
jgi:hypothetical protein